MQPTRLPNQGFTARLDQGDLMWQVAPYTLSDDPYKGWGPCTLAVHASTVTQVVMLMVTAAATSSQ